MGWKNPDGSPMSGAQQAKEKKRRAEAARQHESTRKAEAKGESANGFDDLPAPPIKQDGTAELVTWAAKGLALTVYRAIQDPSIFETEKDRLKFLADGFAKIGIVRDKAAEQDRIKRGLKKLKDQEQDVGLTDVTGPPPPPISPPR